MPACAVCWREGGLTTGGGFCGPGPGQLLCGGLFSNDRLSNWFSAVALAHGLIDQEEIKVTSMPYLYIHKNEYSFILPAVFHN